MLTRRAWWLLTGGVVSLVAGRLLGVAELYLVGTTMGLLVFGAALLVRCRPVPLVATRRLAPPRVHCGQAARVDLRLDNPGRHRSPVVLARDPFDAGRRWARFRVAPIAAGAGASSAYRVPTEHRGVFRLGPLHLARQDPLGLALRAVETADAAALIVYPAVDRIPPLPHTRGHDPRGGRRPQPAMGPQGDEFYALRPYVIGDDLRRVHWPSSARADELLVRQDELPWQGRAAVVLDNRSAINTADGFEVAVSAAASILAACVKAGAEVRLLTADGSDSGWGSGAHHLDLLLERLAEIGPTDSSDASIVRLLGGLRRSGSDCALAVVTTARAADADLEAVTRARRARTSTTLILLEESALHGAPGRPSPDLDQPNRAGTGDRPVDHRAGSSGDYRANKRSVPALGTTVRVTGSVAFAEAWSAATRPSRAARVSAGR